MKKCLLTMVPTIMLSTLAVSCADKDSPKEDHKNSCSGKGLVKDVNGNCVCNESTHWRDDNGKCICVTGYEEKNEGCVKIENKCPDKGLIDDGNGNCICNESAHWTGDPNDCYCDTGYEEKGGNCIELKCDGEGQMKEECGLCGCKAAEGYVLTSAGICSKETGCDAYRHIYNESLSLCECNATRHWTGAGENCYCATGFTEINNTCLPTEAD